MYDDNDFFAVAKFLKLGIKLYVTNPMGAHSSFQTTFPTPKGATVTLNEKSLYDIERKLRALIASDIPVRTKLTPFPYLGTNFRAMLYFSRGVDEFIVQETRDLFGQESKKIIRKAEHLIQLLS